MNERALFMAALEKEDAALRQAYLDEACAGDAVLRERVEALLRSHERPGEFLDVPAVEQLATADVTRAETPPEVDEVPSLAFLTPSDKPGSLGRLEHYEVQQVVGHGGMGIVLRAFDEELHRVVAIKVMAAQLATSAIARKRFKREAIAAAAVSHDHIVTIHAVEDNGELPYLVMQYVAGASLQERLDRDGPLRLDEILRIGMQTAAGLAAAHAQGLVHRDIKPANILLENGVERVKITDFGLARAAADASVTQSGIIAGTPQYMAPEQANGEAVDGRADLFSLGSVLYAMCTGRAPFRASGTVAVLKRVCEETPTPIRDTNPEIPEWLVAIIDKLHAKDPSMRFQSAAEVAELLNRHLAHVQHPSVVGQASRLPAVSKAGGTPAPRQSGWAAIAAAAVLLCLLGGLSLTEATGITNLRATVIRILTPEGTLVVETDDPAVQVTVEGDGGLVITGAGPEEIRLRPGSYRIHADKGGKPIPLDKDLVTVARGGREIVKVKLETAAAAVVAKAEKGAFVLLAAGKERKFDTLAESVEGANDGDTIEIRGNGPFATNPISIGGKALTIRAGHGFRPVLRIVSDKPITRLIATSGRLTLEGLEIRDVTKDYRPSDYYTMIFGTVGSSLHLSNCRLLQEEPQNPFLQLIMGHSKIRLQNCELYSPNPSFVGAGNPSPLRIEMINCVGLGGLATYVLHSHATNPVTVEYRRNTLVASFVATIGFSVAPGPPAPAESNQVKRVLFDAAHNVFDNRATTLLVVPLDPYRASTKWEKREDAQQVFAPTVAWREQSNVYSPGTLSTSWHSNPTPGDNRILSGGNLKEWEEFWGLTDTGSREGQIRLQGGDLRAKMSANGAGDITPEDFRLRADSAGYRAGPDGKDLGADVDLVGPGPAYERWKKTPEYKQWLMDTGQLNGRTAAAKPEIGAFVVQGGPGVAERRFDTLAEAMQGASDGDTIEIRGNGPFVSSPINLGRTALTIRAGEGFRPVVKLSPEAVPQKGPFLVTSAALVLEGLEFHRAPPNGPPGTGGNSAVHIYGAPLRAANCRFRAPVWANQSPACMFRNCEFLATEGNFGGHHGPDARVSIENCVYLNGWGALGSTYDDPAWLRDISFQVERSTFVGAYSLEVRLHGPLPQASQPIRLQVARCIFDVPNVLCFNQTRAFADKAAVLEPAEAEAMLRRRLEWQGECNLFARGSASVGWHALKPQPPHGPKSLEEWKRFWETAEADSLEGTVRFQGGNLLSRTEQSLDGLTPDDFRLRPDSAGYRAGPDGKDLGADVDLVGPGPAYERWKQTPEYQKWLRELATAGHGGSLADPAPPLAVVPFDTPQAKAHQAAWAAHLGVPVEYTNSVGMKFRLIPPGEFTMGTPSDVAGEIVASHQSLIADHERTAILSEGVPHPVRLTQPFYLGQFEVTRAQYRQFVEAKGYKTDPERNGLGGWSNFDGKWVRRREHVWSTPGQWQLSDDEPACILSWNDSHAFCDWLSEVEGRCYTLPTEAQWEFSCRAGTMGPTYAASEESRSDIAWTSELVGEYDLTRHRPQPVGRKRPNAFGLYDMLGNVWEHCADRYAPGPEQAELRIDPTGPPQGDLRVFRGGAWYRSGSAFARASARGYTEPSDPVVDAGIGFRVAIVGIPRFSAPTQNKPGSPTQP